jgi:hypothetical protein
MGRGRKETPPPWWRGPFRDAARSETASRPHPRSGITTHQSVSPSWTHTERALEARPSSLFLEAWCEAAPALSGPSAETDLWPDPISPDTASVRQRRHLCDRRRASPSGPAHSPVLLTHSGATHRAPTRALPGHRAEQALMRPVPAPKSGGQHARKGFCRSPTNDPTSYEARPCAALWPAPRGPGPLPW